MAYTPELSQKHSCTLRRVAWALGKPMTKSLEQIFDWIGETADSNKICKSCHDWSLCHECVFHKCQENSQAT